MNHFINCVTKKYATFNGRASRQEYWMFYLFYMIFAILISVIEASILGTPQIIYSLFTLALFIPSTAALIRRLHDTSNSGHQIWWSLTIIGVFWVLYLALKRGDYGTNKYD
jgi:uncharacterized membrane protein YhaH (DUF805 family)